MIFPFRFSKVHSLLQTKKPTFYCFNSTPSSLITNTTTHSFRSLRFITLPSSTFHSSQLSSFSPATTTNTTGSSSSTTFPRAHPILIKPNPWNSNQWILTFPDPTFTTSSHSFFSSSSSSSSSVHAKYIQLVDQQTTLEQVLNQFKLTFPHVSVHTTIGFSNQPFQPWPSNLMQCVQTNLIFWIQTQPYFFMTSSSETKSSAFHSSSLSSVSSTSSQLLQHYHTIDSMVAKKIKTYMYLGASYLVAQWSTMIYLTYELGWDVMEPVSYLVGLGTTILGATYYALFRSEYTYEDAFQRLALNLAPSASFPNSIRDPLNK